MSRAMEPDVEPLSLGAPSSSPRAVIIRHVVPADSGGFLAVLVTGEAGVSGSVFVALAGRGRLCGLQPRCATLDGRADIGATEEWNEGVVRAAPELRVADPAAARRVAMAALSYATGYVWDTVWTAAHRVSTGWSVSGVLAGGGSRRLFAVHLTRDGRVGTLFLQYPPDSVPPRRWPAVQGERLAK